MAQRILSFQSHLFLLYYCRKPFLICTLFVIIKAPKSHILCWYCTLCCNIRDWTQGLTHASRYSFYHRTLSQNPTHSFYVGHWVNHCRILLVILSPLGDLTVFNDLILSAHFYSSPFILQICVWPGIVLLLQEDGWWWWTCLIQFLLLHDWRTSES